MKTLSTVANTFVFNLNRAATVTYLDTEEGLAPEIIGGLQALGHGLEMIRGHARVGMGGGQVIQRNPETGRFGPVPSRGRTGVP